MADSSCTACSWSFPFRPGKSVAPICRCHTSLVPCYMRLLWPASELGASSPSGHNGPAVFSMSWPPCGVDQRQAGPAHTVTFGSHLTGTSDYCYPHHTHRSHTMPRPRALQLLGVRLPCALQFRLRVCTCSHLCVFLIQSLGHRAAVAPSPLASLPTQPSVACFLRACWFVWC